MAARRSLANLPTALERLDRISAELDAEIWVKRDDLTGSALSGNKVRKLEYLLGEALEQGADVLVTCGAVTSNHCRATAVAAARCGLSSHLVLRGVQPELPDGNLLLDRLVGAETTFITEAQWREREAIMAAIAEDLRRAGRTPYVIPEGGSNAVGALGYVEGARELREQAEAAGLDVRRVVHATGSGGTTAGLALGFAGRPDVDVIGVAVCDDRAYFDEVVGRIVRAVDADAAPAWTILEGYKGVGYAQATRDELAFYAHVARTEGLILDPVYTGKAFRALYEEIKAGRWQGDGATVFLHTGGIFGLFSFARELDAVV
jgi:D-cysteine desulfhydrase